MVKPIKFLGTAVTLALLSLVVFQYGGEKLFSVVRSLNLAVVSLVFLILLAAFVVSALRTIVVLKDADTRIHWSGAAHASLMGAVGNIFLNMIGYTTARTVYLRSLGVNVADSILLSFYEKFIALAVLFFMSVVGAVYLFGSISLDFYGQAFLLLKISITAVLCLALGLAFSHGAEVREYIGRFLFSVNLKSFLRVSALTVVIQGAMLGAYVALGWAIAPQVSLLSLAAASAVVMFAASLPISFSGWGVRELSSVHAFSMVGVSPAGALVIAVTIGALSMAVMFLLASVSSVAAPAYQKNKVADPVDRSTEKLKFRSDILLVVFVILAAASLVFFNLHLPTKTGKINVNLADPVVAVGAVFALVLWFRNGAFASCWRISGVQTTLAAIICVVVYGLVRGWLSFGWFDWAFINRGLGLGVILAYFLTGALAAFAGGNRFLRIFADWFVAAAAAVVLADLGLQLAFMLGVPFDRSVFASRTEGLAQNSNAFAFQLLIAYAVSVSMGNRHALLERSRLLLEGFILAGLWLSASRAGYLGLAVLVLGMTVSQSVAWRRLVLPGVVALVVIVAVTNTPTFLQFLGISSSSASSPVLAQMARSQDAERLHSMLGGLAMWREHWLFGAGLGAFMRGELQASGNPLVIHSTPIWLLAEVGLIGFLAIVIPVLVVVRNLLVRLHAQGEAPIRAALCCLVIMAVEMQPHEMLYQRSFWLILGAMLVTPHGVLFLGRTENEESIFGQSA